MELKPTGMEKERVKKDSLGFESYYISKLRDIQPISNLVPLADS
jgi:hypothetical protein